MIAYTTSCLNNNLWVTFEDFELLPKHKILVSLPWLD